MQHALADFLRAALIPELSSDIAAGTARNVHFALILVAAVGADPHQLAVLILFDGNLAVKAADLTVIALGVQLGYMMLS